MSHKIIRLSEVKQRTGLSRSTIYLRMSKGLFPKSISLGGRAVGWVERSIDIWISECIATSKGGDDA